MPGDGISGFVMPSYDMPSYGGSQENDTRNVLQRNQSSARGTEYCALEVCSITSDAKFCH
jgi:hypothetical protein